MRKLGTTLRKRRSTRGATLLFALMVALVCAMVAAVILPSSTTALRRVHNDRAFRQENLTLQSAAEVLAAQIRRIDYHFVETTTVTRHITTDPETHEVTSNSTSSNYSTTTQYLSDATGSETTSLASDLVEDVKRAVSQESDTTKRNYTISISSTDSDAREALKNVTAEVWISVEGSESSPTYNVRANLYLEGHKTDGQYMYIVARNTDTNQSYYEMTQGAPVPADSDGASASRVTHEITWSVKNVDISNKEPHVDKEEL